MKLLPLEKIVRITLIIKLFGLSTFQECVGIGSPTEAVSNPLAFFRHQLPMCLGLRKGRKGGNTYPPNETTDPTVPSWIYNDRPPDCSEPIPPHIREFEFRRPTKEGERWIELGDRCPAPSGENGM